MPSATLGAPGATPLRCDRRATKLSAEQAGSRRRRGFFRNLLDRCGHLGLSIARHGCAGECFDDRDERAHRRTGRAFGLERRLAIEIRRAGDIEMNPRHVGDEVP